MPYIYYLLPPSNTETSLPRFPPLPLYRSNTYFFTPFRTRSSRHKAASRRVPMSSELKHIANVKNNITGLIYIAHMRYVCHEAQKIIKKGMQHEVTHPSTTLTQARLTSEF